MQRLVICLIIALAIVVSGNSQLALAVADKATSDGTSGVKMGGPDTKTTTTTNDCTTATCAAEHSSKPRIGQCEALANCGRPIETQTATRGPQCTPGSNDCPAVTGPTGNNTTGNSTNTETTIHRGNGVLANGETAPIVYCDSHVTTNCYDRFTQSMRP